MAQPLRFTWWASLVKWASNLFSRRKIPLRLRANHSDDMLRSVFGNQVLGLRPEVQHELTSLLAHHPGVAVSTVIAAIADFHDLKELLNGPGASDVVGDVSLLGEAEALLTSLLSRAAGVAVLANVAGESRDKEAREAAGDAILALQDQRQILQQVTSSALRWASTQRDEDLTRYRQCAARLASEVMPQTQTSSDTNRE